MNAPRIGRAVALLLGAVACWLCWAMASRFFTGRPVPWGSAYLVAPLGLLAGVALGGVLARLPRSRRVPEVVAVAAVVALAVPFCANAKGAVGLQLVALAGLMLLTFEPQTETGRPRQWLRAVLAVVAVLGGLMALGSDAAAILTFLLCAVGVAVVGFGRGPGKRTVTAGAVLVLVWAATVVVWLGSRASWPAWLNANLSSARHELWSDALELWRAHPAVGAGAGGFLESSALAQRVPSLEMAHSSVLQVGAELGLVGVLAFALLGIGVISVAAQGERRAATVAVVAFTFFGVHSMIDHLWEFPVVVIAVGVVVGWGAATKVVPTDAGVG